ncbi:DIP1984 family protein [Kitasatospora azatica]|uniref:DIP1984 family protein n=1 Tax=Kitasatospora azatica TaxID=58347 RepID=UPI00055B5901|nr:hypothetical protein [Kitasatospora azatica]
MKLAEALAQRAAAVRRVEQLRARVVGSARYQEGEELLSALPVAELRAQADLLAKEIREVDTLIQRTNWEIDLIED